MKKPVDTNPLAPAKTEGDGEHLGVVVMNVLLELYNSPASGADLLYFKVLAFLGFSLY